MYFMVVLFLGFFFFLKECTVEDWEDIFTNTIKFKDH